MGEHTHSISMLPHDHGASLYGGYITDYFKEEYDHYIIEIEAPRFTKEDLHVLFKDDILTITGEIRFGGRVKTIDKVFGVKDAEDFDITLENGVLQIIAHKKPETLAKKLAIK